LGILFIERSSFPNFDPYCIFSDIQLEVSQIVFITPVLSSEIVFITPASSPEIVVQHFSTKS
jgi:hypothetical protein